MILTKPRLYFTIDGVPSATPAWDMTNMLELIKPAKKRGAQPVIIPGASGGRANPLRIDVTERVINGQVFGRLNENGVPYADEITGLQTNLTTLRNAWAAIPGTTNSTRTLVLHLVGGTTLSGPVQVIDMDWDYDQMPVVANVVVRLLVPAGELT